MVKYVLDNWENSVFIEMIKYYDEYEFVFDIPEEDSAFDFISFAYDVKVKFYKREADQDKIRLSLP
jgi:hypothetical protein